MAIIKHMFHFLSLFGQNLQYIVEQGGYLFLFLITIFEGIPVAGQFVPGQTIVIVSGFLAKLEVLNLSAVTIIVVVGALIGDIIGFFLGKKYGLDFLNKFGSYFFIKNEYIEKARRLVQEHSVKTIILGRFSPITRPLTPFIVGASGINIRRFWLLDFLAVLLWSLVSLAIGYTFGASYHAASAFLGKFIVIAIIIGILVVWGYRFINKNFHIFAKYELITLGLNLFGLYIFFKTIQDALTDKAFMLELDLYVNNFFVIHTSEFWLSFMNIITDIFSTTSITILIFIAIIYFIYIKKYYYALISFISIAGGYLSTLMIKNIIMRARPEDAFILETGYSFPSGHAMTATILFTLIVYFFVIKVKSIIWREVLIVICVLALLLVAFTRIYLGVHWLSDVIAGIGLGLFLTTLMILLAKYIMMVMGIIRRK